MKIPSQAQSSATSAPPSTTTTAPESSQYSTTHSALYGVFQQMKNLCYYCLSASQSALLRPWRALTALPASRLCSDAKIHPLRRTQNSADAGRALFRTSRAWRGFGNGALILRTLATRWASFCCDQRLQLAYCLLLIPNHPTLSYSSCLNDAFHSQYSHEDRR